MEIILADLNAEDSFVILGKDDQEIAFPSSRFRPTEESYVLTLFGGLGESASLATLESSTEFPSNSTLSPKQIGLAVIDLSELGYEEGETISTLSLHSGIRSRLDPLLLFALQPQPADLNWVRFASGIENQSARGIADDPDGDGTSNLVEYAFGRNPNLPDDGQGRVKPHFDGDRFSIIFPRNPDLLDAGYVVEFSSDLIHWEPAWQSAISIAPNNAGPDFMQIFDSVEMTGGQTSRFGRLRVVLFR